VFRDAPSQAISAFAVVATKQLTNLVTSKTADIYGHLFPRGDDGAELAAAEKAFLAG
jgi:integrase